MASTLFDSDILGTVMDRNEGELNFEVRGMQVIFDLTLFGCCESGPPRRGPLAKT